MKVYETPPWLTEPSDIAKYFRLAATRHFFEAARLLSRALGFYLLHLRTLPTRAGSLAMTILRYSAGFQRQTEIAAYKPPLKNHLEKIDNKLHEHGNDDEHENQNTQNSCVHSVSTGAHKLNPNVELTGAAPTGGEAKP